MGKENRRQGTEMYDWEQRMGDKEQRSEAWNRGWDTRNRDVRKGTKDGRQGTVT